MIKLSEKPIMGYILIAFGLLAIGFGISFGPKNFVDAQKFVEVRGLAEREVISNYARWDITLAVNHGKKDLYHKQLEAAWKELESFLVSSGFVATEFARGRISDSYEDEYEENGKVRRRVPIAQIQVNISTSKLNLIDAIGEWPKLRDGVEVKPGTLNFFYTQLNDIKPDMLRESVENAFRGAKGFEQHSGARVGKILSATQGLFTITGAWGQDESSGGLSRIKKVRVVTKIKFALS